MAAAVAAAEKAYSCICQLWLCKLVVHAGIDLMAMGDVRWCTHGFCRSVTNPAQPSSCATCTCRVR
jgi:hypothetical protein